MATAFSLSDEILRVFNNSNKTEMRVDELIKTLSNRNIDIKYDKLTQILRSPSLLNLFNIQHISNNLYLIQLNPKLTLCKYYLQGRCKNKINCNKLHICRIASHFPRSPHDKPCHFPHRLSDNLNNVILLKKYHYQTLDEDLLLRLLQIYYLMNKSKPQSATPTRLSLPQTETLTNPTIPKIDDVRERQLDISIPSQAEAREVDCEIVELLLAGKNIIVEKKVDESPSNEFYRRYTVQLKTKQDVDNLLQTEPIIMYNKVPIKFKRTLRRKDQYIFMLKFNTNQKIDKQRFNLYLEMLIGKVERQTFDMTTDDSDEQVYLIRCEEPIDFKHLNEAYQTKNTLQNYRVTVVEIYEAENIEVSFSNNQRMNLSRLRQLIGENRWQKEVFTCDCSKNDMNAEIELMNAQVVTQWLSDVGQDRRLTIHPIIDSIVPAETNAQKDDTDEEVTKLCATPNIPSPFSSSTISESSPKREDNSAIYWIKRNWRVVLTHPTFNDEYKTYIREKLNISVQITGSSIKLPDEHIRTEFARFTNQFIQKFVFHELSDLSPPQVKLIKTNYSRMAHKWYKDTNKTLIAAHRDVMNEIFPKPTAPSRPQSPVIIEENSKEEQIQTLTYPIENTVYFPFFSPSNSFSQRLQNYLSNSFHIKLDIKQDVPTQIQLELKGLVKEVAEARSMLASLFSSLKTKSYSDIKPSIKYSIPDIVLVAQWKLNQSSIVASCSHSLKDNGTLIVRYFSDHPQFGVEEQKIDNLISDDLFSIPNPFKTRSTKISTKFDELQQKLKQRSDYGQEICCQYKYQPGSIDEFPVVSINLCGTKSIVLQISQEIKKISDQYLPIPCDIKLTAEQIDFLLNACTDDLMVLERQFDGDGVDLRSRLRRNPTSQFTAPKYLHEKIKSFLLEMSQTQVLSQDIICSRQLIDREKNELTNLALSKQCLLSIALSPQLTSSNQSTIHISNGDLTSEQSEVLVICSSSMQLFNAVVKAAGKAVEQELQGIDLAKNIIDTSVGQLKQAKRLLFLSWTPPDSYLMNQDIDALRQSIVNFVQQAINFTIQRNFKSIAFPAIGCGGYGIQPDLIATIMINSICEQIKADSAVQLVVTFVTPHTRVFDAFSLINKSTTGIDVRGSHSSTNRESFKVNLTTSHSNVSTAKTLLATIENILTQSSSSEQ